MSSLSIDLIQVKIEVEVRVKLILKGIKWSNRDIYYINQIPTWLLIFI